MNRKEFHQLISVENAMKIIEGMGVSAGTENVSLKDALGRVLSEDIISQIDIPPFDRASMDGYAVRAEDTYEAREDRPVELQLTGSIRAGETPDMQVNKTEAAEISTGAPVPEGGDAVVMVEHTDSSGDTVSIRRPVAIGENIMKQGADLQKGEVILWKNALLTPSNIGVLAAAGVSEAPVISLKVAVLSTGNEITAPDKTLKPGSLYDVNTYTIGAAVKECGATPVHMEPVQDEPEALLKALEEASNVSDIVLVSGGTSAGTGDILHVLLEEHGEMLAHGINLKPGKPLIIARFNDKPLIGLPGYPTSALMTFNQLVAPLLRNVMHREQDREVVKARLSTRVHSIGRRQLLTVALRDGMAVPVFKSSGAITSLADADGYIDIPAEVEILEKDEVVEVVLI